MRVEDFEIVIEIKTRNKISQCKKVEKVDEKQKKILQSIEMNLYFLLVVMF